MAADPDPSELPVDPHDPAGATDDALAEVVAVAWETDGYRTTVKEHGSHVFVFAKRQVDGEIRGEIVWVAGERAVESTHLEQLRALAEKTGADSAACLTVGSGGVAGSAAAAHDVTPLDGDDLRAKLGVEDAPDSSPDADTLADDPPVGSGEGDTGPGDGLAPPDDETGGAADGPTPGADDDGGEPDLGGNGATADLDGLGDVGDDPAGTAVEDGSTGSAVDTSGGDAVGSGASGRRLDAWDGQTTGEDVDRPPFDGLWAAVTRGDAVETVADLSVWDGTSR